MKYVKFAMALGMLASLICCDRCDKKAEVPKKEEISSPATDGGKSASPSDAGAKIDMDGGKTSSLDGSVHVFDAAVISIDASTEETTEDAESGPSDLNRG